MPTASNRSPASWALAASYGLALVALFLVLHLHLLLALLAGLTVNQLIAAVARRLPKRFSAYGHLAAVVILGIVIVAALTPLVFAMIGWLARAGAAWPELATHLQSLLDAARRQLPAPLLSYLPNDPREIQTALVSWIHTHVTELQVAGRTAVTALVHVMVGMVMGALVAFEAARPGSAIRPLSRELVARVTVFAEAFRQIVFAQFRISLLNTAMTALFLLVVMPLLGHELPLIKTLIIFTFIVGLLPVVGNLISNAAIVLVALSVAWSAAVAAMIFLILIHKLEYFLNARIVGGRIHASAWEILLAMLVMEAAFGLTGLIAAPIFYAYIKAELSQRAWV